MKIWYLSTANGFDYAVVFAETLEEAKRKASIPRTALKEEDWNGECYEFTPDMYNGVLWFC